MDMQQLPDSKAAYSKCDIIWKSQRTLLKLPGPQKRLHVPQRNLRAQRAQEY